MMDVSDGLLLDAGADGRGERLRGRDRARRRAACPTLCLARGDGEARLDGGDRRRRLRTAVRRAAGRARRHPRLAEEIGLPLSRIGRFDAGAGLALTDDGDAGPAARTARLRASR